MARTKTRKQRFQKRYTKKHRSSTAGKILPPLDVRSPKHLKDFEKRLRKGPLTIVLVYADWCGHCHTMMPHFDSASKSPSRSIQSVKVNEEMLNSVNDYINRNVNKSAKPLSVEGYPSIILVNNKGDKISDVEPVRNTETMTKVMNETGKIGESLNKKNNNTKTNTNTNTNTTTNVNKNANVGEDELKGSLVANNSRSRMKPDDMLIKSEDLSKPTYNNINTPVKNTNNDNNMNKKVNNKKANNKKNTFNLEDSIAPSPLNTFTLPKNTDKEPNFNAPKDIEKQAEELVNMRGPIEPPSLQNDMITDDLSPAQKLEGGGRRGGSLISSISHTAYTLAAPAALLATASYVMKDSKRKHTRKTRKNKNKARGSYKKSHKVARRR